MSSLEIIEYYEATGSREIREDLIFAVENVAEPKIAIDCGCGAGADIAYLVVNEFLVYGFDIEEEAVSRCRTRFKHNDRVILAQSSFVSFEYPAASLVVADASLFFCPVLDFPEVLKQIYDCLYPGGIFYASFLGPEDTMANRDGGSSVFWPDIAVFEEQEIRAILQNYEILRFNVHRISGTNLKGEAHEWHVFSVVARKSTNLK